MSKFWLIFKYEYLRHVMRKRFIFAILSMPFFMAVLVGIGFLAVAVQYKSAPMGYVDQSNLFKNASLPTEKKGDIFPPVKLVRFENEETAQKALENKEIQVFFVIQTNYLASGSVRQISLDKPGPNTTDQFRDFLRYNLLADQPANISRRLVEGTSYEVRSTDGSRQMGEDQWFNVVLPIFAGVLFLIVVNISGGYLLQAVVEEKENRTMEIVITSVSPGQLMAGKIAGNLSVGLTQLLVWLLFALVALTFARMFIPGAENLTIHADFVWLMLLMLLPAFVMIAAMMAAVGATVTETQEAQQIAGLFSLPIAVPFWLLPAMMQSPNGAVALALSFFPLTAPVAMPLRVVFTTVPAWQIAVSIALSVACAAAALWFAGRAFRLGMLRYGKRISWKELLRRAA